MSDDIEPIPVAATFVSFNELYNQYMNALMQSFGVPASLQKGDWLAPLDDDCQPDHVVGE